MRIQLFILLVLGSLLGSCTTLPQRQNPAESLAIIKATFTDDAEVGRPFRTITIYLSHGLKPITFTPANRLIYIVGTNSATAITAIETRDERENNWQPVKQPVFIPLNLKPRTVSFVDTLLIYTQNRSGVMDNSQIYGRLDFKNWDRLDLARTRKSLSADKSFNTWLVE